MLSKIVLLIPALDPDEKFISIIGNLKNNGFNNIVIVDDGSDEYHKDIFRRISDENLAHVLTHAVNLGKGRALKTGINHILNVFPDCRGVITADSDGQHKPDDIKRVAQDFLEHPESLILGSRSFSMGDKNIPFRSKFGNLLTIKIFGFLSGIKISDTQTGLRAIPKSFMKILLNVQGERFDFEMYMLMECRRLLVPIREVFIETIYIAENKSSHFNPLIDSIKIYYIFLKYIFSSLLTTIIDFIVFYMITTLGVGIGIAMFWARVVASLANFTINRSAVFESKNKIYQDLIKYYGLVVVSGITSYLLIMLMKNHMALSTICSKIIAESFLFLINYSLQNNYVFKNTKRENNE
ncbi:MAG: bifunctional glycosyltransferase family 2/GtrA family protein [Candidatus Wallbacteria bacterium]